MINMENLNHQLELYSQIVENNLSVRDVEGLVKAKKASPTDSFAITGTDWDPEIDRITEAFYKKLNAAVHLKAGSKGKGKIIISYKNKEDLERILNLIED